MTKLSIIIPAYNCENYIGKCLNSIIEQKFQDFEVIIVNDGSTDRTKDICVEYLNKDSRIKLINQKNSGVSNSRNKGITEANGEYIQFVDADDTLEKNMIYDMVQEIEKNKTDLIICGYNRVSKSKVTPCPLLNRHFIDKNNLDKYFLKLYSETFLNPPWNKIYRKDKIQKLFNPLKSLGEDLEFNLDYIYGIQSLSLLESCLYNYSDDVEESLTKLLKETTDDLIDVYKNLIIKVRCMNFKDLEGVYLFFIKAFIRKMAEYIQDNKLSFNESVDYIKSVCTNQRTIEFIQDCKVTKLKNILLVRLIKDQNFVLLYCLILIRNKIK